MEVASTRPHETVDAAAACGPCGARTAGQEAHTRPRPPGRWDVGESTGRHAAPEARSPEIRLDAVSRIYPNGHRALDRIALWVPPGQFVALLGRSGAGKTTLLKCLARSAPPSEGRIWFGDEEVTRLGRARLRAHRARVGVIFQQFNLVRRLTVLDNVLIGRLGHLRGWRSWAAAARWFGAEDRSIAARCLAHVGMLEKAWQRVDTLSGGEQQRVAIARILAQEPRLVLADEPIASLDVANGHLVMQTLRHVATELGITVVAALHHVDHARRYADRIIGLAGGRTVFDGRPEALDADALTAIFGEVPAEAARLRPAAGGRGWP